MHPEKDPLIDALQAFAEAVNESELGDLTFRLRQYLGKPFVTPRSGEELQSLFRETVAPSDDENVVFAQIVSVLALIDHTYRGLTSDAGQREHVAFVTHLRTTGQDDLAAKIDGFREARRRPLSDAAHRWSETRTAALSNDAVASAERRHNIRCMVERGRFDGPPSARPI